MSDKSGAWINNLSGEIKAVGSKTKSETICFERSIRTTMDVVALGGYPVTAVRQHVEVTDEDGTRAIEPDAITVMFDNDYEDFCDGNELKKHRAYVDGLGYSVDMSPLIVTLADLRAYVHGDWQLQRAFGLPNNLDIDWFDKVRTGEFRTDATQLLDSCCADDATPVLVFFSELYRGKTILIDVDGNVIIPNIVIECGAVITYDEATKVKENGKCPEIASVEMRSADGMMGCDEEPIIRVRPKDARQLSLLVSADCTDLEFSHDLIALRALSDETLYDIAVHRRHSITWLD